MIRYYTIFLSYFIKQEKKNSKILQASFLMFEISKVDSKATIESSSIKFFKVAKISKISLSFKHIVMVKCNASLKNWCSQEKENHNYLKNGAM
jgi:hypothetical protein